MGDFDTKVFGCIDLLNVLAMEGVDVMNDLSRFSDAQDLTLCQMELHLPFSLSFSKLL